MEKIKLNTAEGKALMKQVGAGVLITLHGEITMAKYMTKPLEGEDLKKDIDYMLSKGNQPNRNPRYRFNMTNVTIDTQGRSELNAAEQYVWQSVYVDKEGRPARTVEMGSKDFIENKIAWGNPLFGYRGPDGLIYPCDVMGKNIANGQGVTVTFKTYQQKNGDISVGFENLVFDSEPQFYVPQAHVMPQGWVQAPVKKFDDPAGVPTEASTNIAPAPVSTTQVQNPAANVAPAVTPVVSEPQMTASDPAPVPVQPAVTQPTAQAEVQAAVAPTPVQPATQPAVQATVQPTVAQPAVAPAIQPAVQPTVAQPAVAPGFAPNPTASAASAWD